MRNLFSIQAGRIDALVSWAIGLVFLASAIPHLMNPYFYLSSIYELGFSKSMGQALAICVPTLQLVLGISLVLDAFRDTANILSIPLLTAFLILQVNKHLEGATHSCGCFGARHSEFLESNSLWIVVTLFCASLVRLAFQVTSVFYSQHEKEEMLLL